MDKTKSDIEHTISEEDEEGTGSEEENEETIIEETYKETDDGIVWRTIRKTTVITPKQTTEKFEVLGGITSTLPSSFQCLDTFGPCDSFNVFAHHYFFKAFSISAHFGLIMAFGVIILFQILLTYLPMENNFYPNFTSIQVLPFLCTHFLNVSI